MPTKRIGDHGIELDAVTHTGDSEQFAYYCILENNEIVSIGSFFIKI